MLIFSLCIHSIYSSVVGSAFSGPPSEVLLALEPGVVRPVALVQNARVPSEVLAAKEHSDRPSTTRLKY